MAEQHKERITNITASLMIATAFIFDIISAFPIGGQLVADTGSTVVFLIWFLILGLPLLSPRKILTYAGAFIISIIPVISALPEITLAIVIFILITRTEDKLGVQVLSKKGLSNPSSIAGGIRSQSDRLQERSGGALGRASSTAKRFGIDGWKIKPN